jgi:hypothetical protein
MPMTREAILWNALDTIEYLVDNAGPNADKDKVLDAIWEVIMAKETLHAMVDFHDEMREKYGVDDWRELMSAETR